MRRIWTRWMFYLSAFAACSVLALTTGCASGGFKLTRQYAGWVNQQHIVLRIVLYILTLVVFAVTMLIDLVAFNTMDFWDGKVSAGDYQFSEGGKTFFAHHEYQPGTKLKRSTIKVMDSENKLLQEVVLNETKGGEVELFVDGKLRSRGHGVSEIPTVSIFDIRGKLIEKKIIFSSTAVAKSAAPVTVN